MNLRQKFPSIVFLYLGAVSQEKLPRIFVILHPSPHPGSTAVQFNTWHMRGPKQYLKHTVKYQYPGNIYKFHVSSMFLIILHSHVNVTWLLRIRFKHFRSVCMCVCEPNAFISLQYLRIEIHWHSPKNEEGSHSLGKITTVYLLTIWKLHHWQETMSTQWVWQF